MPWYYHGTGIPYNTSSYAAGHEASILGQSPFTGLGHRSWHTATQSPFTGLGHRTCHPQQLLLSSTKSTAWWVVGYLNLFESTTNWHTHRGHRITSVFVQQQPSERHTHTHYWRQPPSVCLCLLLNPACRLKANHMTSTDVVIDRIILVHKTFQKNR